MALSEKAIGAIRSLTRHLVPARAGEADEYLADLVERRSRGVPCLLHPDVFQWYYQLAEKAKQGDEHRRTLEASRLIDKLPEVKAVVLDSFDRAEANAQVLGASLDLDVGNSLAHASLARGEDIASGLSGSAIELRMVEEPDPEFRAELKEAFGRIRDLWPEMYEEVQDFVARLILFEGRFALEYTDFRYHGAVFLRIDHIGDAIDLAADVLHEAAHVRLNNLLAVSPLILNDESETYSSPLRPDPRPMFGVFHQMYVLVRLAGFYERMIERGDDRCADEFKRTTEGFEAALEVVNQHADLTQAGQELMTSVNAYANTLLSRSL